MIRSKAKELNWALVSRALNNHDACTVYTLLSERYKSPIAGQALLKLIETIPDWPKANRGENVNFDQLLSCREMQTLRCAERGLSVLGTAKELVLSEHTIRGYRRAVIIKLESKSIVEAIHCAHELGLIE